MPLVQLVIALALAQFFFLLFAVGKARGTYKVAAPATTGNEVFERYFRVQMNTLELLVMFVPAMFMFSQYFGGYRGAGLGSGYLVGRRVYFTRYVKIPSSRGLGYGLSVLPIMIFIVGALIGAIRAAVLTYGS